MINDLKDLIESAERILITSHTSPDPDAVASTLLLGTTLEFNYPNKNISMVLENQPDSLEFLDGYQQISFNDLAAAISEHRPELLIIVDANNYSRVSRHGAERIARYMRDSGAKLAIVDHHLADGKADADIFINNQNSSAAQEVYEVCFEKLKLRKPNGYAQTTMAGLYSDSGGFAYLNNRQEKLFKLASDLVADGANIESIKNLLNRYSADQMKVLAELMNNLTSGSDYTYSFLSDEFVKNWVKSGKSLPALHIARKRFVNEYARNVDDRTWGFVVSLDPQESDEHYSVSFRSMPGNRDVNELAKKLGGGGHKYAAGADVNAQSLGEAVSTVKAAIASS